MNIIFEQLELQNFKSIGELIVINYNDLAGFNYVYGVNLDAIDGTTNGSGKSSIIVDGIIFALFGKTLKNTNNQYIPNRNCNKKLETFAKLTFTVDNQRYKSECKIAGCCQITLLKEISLNTNEWEDITQSTVVKTRQYIQEHILGCSFDIFKSSIIISASDCVNFYEGMTKNAKRNYIENIFNLNCFGIMFNNIKTDLNETKKELSYTNNEIIKISQQLEIIQKKYNDFDKSLKQNLQDSKKLLIKKANDIKDLQQKILLIKNSLCDSDEIKQQLTNLKEKEIILLKNTEKLKNDIDKAQYKIKTINKTIEELSQIKNGLCEKCIKIMDQRYDFEKQIKTINALTNFIKVKNNNLIELENLYNNLLEEKNELEIKNSKIKNSENELYKFNISLQSLSEDIKKHTEKYKQMKNQSSNPFEELLNQTFNTLSDLKEKLILYSKNIKHMELLKDTCSETGVKRIIIKDIVKILNSLIQKYLNEIGADYLVYFDESFDFKFITINGECEYSSFSTGERKRIQIATIFAFIDLINGKINSNVLVLDEFLDEGIDSIAIKNVINILKRKATDTHQSIFIISHRSETLEDNIFDHVIEVTKKNGMSNISIN